MAGPRCRRTWSSSARSRKRSSRRFGRPCIRRPARRCRGPGRVRTACQRTAEIQEPRATYLYNFTLSAPKSVSVVAALGEDDRLVQGHQQAVEAALRRNWRPRRRRACGWRAPTRIVSPEIWSSPSITTTPVASSIRNSTRTRWPAISRTTGPRAAGRRYRRRISMPSGRLHDRGLPKYARPPVRTLGTTLDNRHDARGRDVGFEIRGVSQDLLVRYSQRSQQRDAGHRSVH